MMSEWWEAIKSIPGAVKAIASLVGDIGSLGSSVAHLGIAKVSQRRELIEATTRNEVAIRDAITKGAVTEIHKGETDLVHRAIEHGIGRIITEQQNREAVTRKALEDLIQNPPASTPQDAPSDDWLNLFGRYAENASSEKLREHWSSILANEIRAPGTFSFTTLQLASVLDPKLANTIEKIRPWILSLEAGIPLVGSVARAPLYAELLTLAGIGFLVLAGSQVSLWEYDSSSPITEPVDIDLDFPHGTFVVHYNAPPLNGVEIDLDVAHLTQAARELLSILPPVSPSPDMIQELIRLWTDHSRLVRYEPKQPGKKRGMGKNAKKNK